MLAAPTATTTGASRSFAVVVGIGRYRESLPVATGAQADAKAFAAFAEKTLGLEPSHIKLLLGDRAGLADVRSALEEWLPRNAIEPNGRVYFSMPTMSAKAVGCGAPGTKLAANGAFDAAPDFSPAAGALGLAAFDWAVSFFLWAAASTCGAD